MDVLTNLFQKHISPEKLDDHRSVLADYTRKIAALVSNEIFTASISNSEKELKNASSSVTQSPSSTDITNVTMLHETNLSIVTSNGLNQNLEEPTIDSPRINDSTQSVDESFQCNEVKYISSGSTVEGANLARIFFESTKGEVETDIMYQLLEINETECFEPCDQSNPMFVHIVFKLESNLKDEWIKKFGSEFEKFLIYDCSNGKSTLSSNFIKCKLKSVFDKCPDLFTQMAGIRTNVHKSEWDPEDAAGTFNIVLSNHSKYTGTSESNPQSFEKELFNKLLNVSPEFEQQANDGIQMLKQIQDNFLASRLEGKTKVEQVRIAIEWSKHCLLLTDILCNHRQETICYSVTQIMGFETKEIFENIRAPLKEIFENYLSSFNILFHEPDSVKTEQTLLGLETYVKSLRSLIGFDALLQQNLLFMKTIKWAQKEDLSHSADNLSNISEKITEISIDFVLCCKCNFWPEVAAEWPEREREWPEQSTIKQIVTNGIHIVCKKLRHSEIDWRLSFSVAEIVITQQWTSWQHYIYFIFKSLFYKYLKPLSNESVKVITSFLVKTVMLNVSENFKQSWWCKENAGECLSVLIMTLISAFESKFLPHHFVPTFNLLERASYDKETERILECAVDILNSLLLKPEKEVSSLSATLEIIEEFVNATSIQKAKKDQLNTILSPLLNLAIDPIHNYDFSKWK